MTNANQSMTTSSTTKPEVDQYSTDIVESALHEAGFTVPESIRNKSQWITYRIEEDDDGDPKKVPKAPLFHYKSGTLFNHSPTNTDHAVTFDEAVDFVHKSEEKLEGHSADGVGLVLTADDDLVGIDIDDAYDATSGDIEEWAFDVVQTLDSFSEISPSGTGIHVLCRGELNDDYQIKGDEPHLETYSSKRFLTFTGRRIKGTPRNVQERTDEVQDIQARYMPKSDDNETNTDSDVAPDLNYSSSVSSPELTQDDKELIEMANSRDDKFRRLFENGDTSMHSGDHSRADMALSSKLAWWTESDIEQMERIFRSSALMREKFDEKRGKTTWGRYMLRKAIKRNGR